MEDNPYSTLKGLYSSVPVTALNYSSRLILADNLDYQQISLSGKNFARDYRGLAELTGFTYYAVKKIEEHESRTMKILESWETRSDATLDKLISYLEDMDRHDIIEELIPSLKKNVEEYLENQKPLEIPLQVPEECTIYDAYVSYADEDRYIVSELARCLESSFVGLKLFIRGRDVLAGYSELDTNIELIKNRSNHVLILLTPNFLGNPALEFEVSFAVAFAIEHSIGQRQRMLIPLVLGTCEIPPILSTTSKIDFTNECNRDWMWEKLITSLQPEDIVTPLLSPSEQNAFRNMKKKVEACLEYQKSLEIPIQDPEVFQERNFLSCDDLINKECTIYDAYVSYADEDSYMVADLARYLESPFVGLKLFIRGRDMLSGCVELDTNIELIKNRSKHVLIVLTSNFVRSRALDFQVSFAATLAIEQRQRILVPLVLATCEIPPILSTTSKIDFTNECNEYWMWEKLITSLQS